MPLETSITRNGKLLQLRWGGFHLAAMILAATIDSGKGPFEDNTLEGLIGKENAGKYPQQAISINPADANAIIGFGYPTLFATPLGNGNYTLKSAHRFEDTEDGEILELLPGDVLSAHRTMK